MVLLERLQIDLKCTDTVHVDSECLLLNVLYSGEEASCLKSHFAYSGLKLVQNTKHSRKTSGFLQPFQGNVRRVTLNSVTATAIPHFYYLNTIILS